MQLDRNALPDRRVVVRFEFPDERPGNRCFWMLADNGDAELCYTDPGGEPDLIIDGDPEMARAFPNWNTRRPVLA